MNNSSSHTFRNGKKSFNGKNKEKFKPNFKKKIPTWKQIDTELADLIPKYEQIESSKIQSFTDFPLSNRTLQGLDKAKYKTPTEIQRESIGIALRGYDLLGAAKTGSGKTLAFLIPILECLYRLKWTKFDGLGVLVISPTRELAYQTFEVLKKIGRFHDFSAGLVIGGKDLKTESKIINQTNIIICTPGRLLQHMDETVNFNCDNLKILVLDEADRILDLGFSETMNSIVDNLPSDRQTMLFSATQTKSVKDLARLSLKNPTYVSVHEHSANSTPKNLTQTYSICDTHDKMSFLWSFIRNHLNQKMIVFFQSCKQVKFVYEAFTKMHTGLTTLCLYGTMNQIRRMTVYDDFCRKQNAVLFATDIAARGLDFPSVNWVIQMDCPPDANTYIHRVGRTARYEKEGQALLVLTPSEEEEMINELKLKKIPIEKIEVNMKRITMIDSKLQSFCAGDIELKESAKRALMAYMRSIFLMSNKKLFNIEKIDVAKYSASLGLVTAPRIRFLQKSTKKENKNPEEENDDEDEEENAFKTNKFMKEAKQAESFSFMSTDDNFTFKVKANKKQDLDLNNPKEEEEELETKNKVKIKTKASIVKRLKKKNIKVNEKITFDDEGNRIATGINIARSINTTDIIASELDKKDENTYSGINIEEAKKFMEQEQEYDKKLYKDRIKRMHTEKRLKEKALRRAKRAKTDDNNEIQVTLKTDHKNDDNHDESNNDD